MTDRDWVREVVAEHLVTANETTTWEPVLARKHINQQEQP